MPACWCGCYGMKPTHGLVPYTGVMPIEATIDHTGPDDCERLRTTRCCSKCIAGADGLDPRQYDVRVDKYTAALGRGVARLAHRRAERGLRTCGERGGRGSEGAPGRRASARAGRERSRTCPSRCTWTVLRSGPPIALEGLQMQMMHGNGMGFNWKGLYTTSLLDAHANWRARANELSRTLKISMLIGEYFVQPLPRPLLCQGPEPGARCCARPTTTR